MVRMADRSPPQRPDASRRLLPFDLYIGHVIRQFSGTFHRDAIDAVLDGERFERRSHYERLTTDSMLPRHRLTIFAECGTDRMAGSGAVVAAANVVFARPNDFDGRLDCLRDLNRFLHE